MKRNGPAVNTVAWIVWLAFTAGCSQSRPPVETSTTPASVSGVVMVQGKPVEEGEIFFNPSNAERKVKTASAKLGKDGSYSLTSMVGGNSVRFKGKFLAGHEGMTPTVRQARLNSGENHVNFDLFGENDTFMGMGKPTGSKGVSSP